MSKKTKAQERADRAAELVRQQQARERRRNLLVGAGVVVAMLVVIGGGFLINQARDSSEDVDAASAGSSSYGLAIGDADAPREVVIYEDFLCPYCGQLEALSRDELDRLADEGKVRVDYRPFNLLRTDYSVEAANAFKVVLDASGAEVAKKFHDVLFAEQPPEAGPYPDDDWLVERAVEAGADEDEVRPGIESLDQEEWVDDATDAAGAAGINSSPVILLDGTVYQEGRTLEEVVDNLVAALE